MECLDLTTERLLLRPLSLSDRDLSGELRTNPEVVKYLGEPMTPDGVEQYMPVWIRRGGPNGCIGVWRASIKVTGEKIGTGALLPLPIEEEDTNWDTIIENEMPDGDTEVGYILKQSAWGKGYATEICRCLLRFAFEESPLNEVVATFDIENRKSRRVLEKCGFTDKGMRRAYAHEAPDFRISCDQWIANGQAG